MTLGQIRRELDAGRLTAGEATKLRMAMFRPGVSGGAWRGLLLVAAVVGGAVGLLFLAGAVR